MKTRILFTVVVLTLLCSCGKKPKYPPYHEIKAHRIDSMINAAEQSIPALDSLLQHAQHSFDSLSQRVEANKKALKATEAELNELAAARLQRDSVKVLFDTQCARVKFLHRKLEEVTQKAASKVKPDSGKTAK